MSPARRLKYRDYSAPGLYFVTICANFKRCIFGEVQDKAVKHSALGRIVEEAWNVLPSRFSNIRLHQYIVMPNHVHGIVEISAVTLAQQAAPVRRDQHSNGERTPGLAQLPLLSVIVRSFKADVTRRARLELSWNEGIWQHNYFDRMIRDGREFSNAMRYIAENPVRWQGHGERLAANDEARARRLAQQAAPVRRGAYRAVDDGFD